MDVDARIGLGIDDQPRYFDLGFRRPLARLGDLRQDPVELTAARKALAGSALGGLVHRQRSTAVGALSLDEAVAVDGLGTPPAQEAPALGEMIARNLRARDALAVLKIDAIDRRAKRDAYSDCIEVRSGFDVSDRQRTGGEALHPLSPSVFLLLFDLERKAFEHTVGYEGSERLQILVAPTLLGLVKGDLHALEEARFVEVGIGPAQNVRRNDGGATHALGLPATNRALLVLPPSALCSHEADTDDHDDERNSDRRILDREADQKVDEVADPLAATAPSTATPSGSKTASAARLGIKGDEGKEFGEHHGQPYST